MNYVGELTSVTQEALDSSNNPESVITVALYLNYRALIIALRQDWYRSGSDVKRHWVEILMK